MCARTFPRFANARCVTEYEHDDAKRCVVGIRPKLGHCHVCLDPACNGGENDVSIPIHWRGVEGCSNPQLFPE